LISTQSREALAILKEKLPTRKDFGARCLSIGAGCLSGCFIKIGIAFTLIGCFVGGEVGLIGLVLIGIGVPFYHYADSKGNDVSLKKGLVKKSGNNNSKTNKGTYWAVLGSLYAVGAFLLFTGVMKTNSKLIIIGLIIIVIGVAYQTVDPDRNKGSS
jgi:cadmium resistance protein CadD (predicted permease)